MDERVLFVYTHPSTFVKGDLAILKRSFRVDKYHFKNNPKHLLPISLAKQLLFLLVNIWRYRHVYIWFADYHSLLPVLFCKITGRDSWLVIGGYDVVRDRKFKYGSFYKPLRACFTINSIKRSSANLCVSKNVLRVVKSISPKSQSYLLYNGVELSPAADTNSGEILCVALVKTVQAFFIKGIDRYNNLAALLPDLTFNLVGCSCEIFEIAGVKKSKNLNAIPPINHTDLAAYYARAHVYCQLSRRESFSLSLAEAMSFGLIPVISNTGGMPEVTGEFGYVTDANNLISVSEAVSDALKKEKNPLHRERVAQIFSIEKREERLISLITKKRTSK